MIPAGTNTYMRTGLYSFRSINDLKSYLANQTKSVGNLADEWRALTFPGTLIKLIFANNVNEKMFPLPSSEWKGNDLGSLRTLQRKQVFR